MKIIYKKPILEQIHAAIHEAKMNGKEIDHIHLTKKEAIELRKACGLPSSLDVPKGGGVLGVRFTVEENEREFISDDFWKDIRKMFEKPEVDCDKEKKKA